MEESLPTPEPPAQVQPAVVPKFRVKFHDGPLAGMTQEYDKELPSYVVFGWTYEATGRREGDFWLYVKRLVPRKARALVTLTVQMMNEQGAGDPRLAPKATPEKSMRRGRNEPCWCDSGKKYKRCHGSSQSS